MKKNPRILVIITNGMIWEAHSDVPIELLIQNNDKEWFRKLTVSHDGNKINDAEDMIKMIKDEKVELPGLTQAAKKRNFIIKRKK